MSKPLCMQLADWPTLDRDLWLAACSPAGFLERPQPASKWSPARRHIVAQAYGQWLAWLDRQGLLDPLAAPQDRVTPGRLEMFISALQDRVSPWSVAIMVGALKRMLDVIAPQSDWSQLSRLCTQLKQTATPSRNRLAHMVTPRQVVDLGLSMMDEVADDHRGHPMRGATRFRDGLMMTMLVCCPMRISNLRLIQIGAHLRRDDDRYWLHFDAGEVKTKTSYEGELPPGLTPYVDMYLRRYRLALLALGSGEQTARLWIDRWGKPMSEAAIRAQIKVNTRNAFGHHIWPHLFRAIAVTGVADEAPEEIGITPDLLGHASIQTTSRHYIFANATRSHQRVQASFLEGRAEARRRLSNRRYPGSDDGDQAAVPRN